MRSPFFVSILAVATLSLPKRADACGAAYPGGPMICTMDDAPSRRAALSSPPPIARVSASWSYTHTTILFGDGRRADLERHAVFAGTEIPVSPKIALRFGAGGIVDGHLALGNGGRARLGPGPTAFFGFSSPIVHQNGAIPFVQISGTLSVTRAGTLGPRANENPSFTAFDLRAAITAGTTLGGWFVPYAAVRGFGGPIFYRYAQEAVTGTDLYKFQVAAGFAASFFRRGLDVFAEGVPLGERGVSAGIGTTF